MKARRIEGRVYLHSYINCAYSSSRKSGGAIFHGRKIFTFRSLINSGKIGMVNDASQGMIAHSPRECKASSQVVASLRVPRASTCSKGSMPDPMGSKRSALTSRFVFIGHRAILYGVVMCPSYATNLAPSEFPNPIIPATAKYVHDGRRTQISILIGFTMQALLLICCRVRNAPHFRPALFEVVGHCKVTGRNRSNNDKTLFNELIWKRNREA